MKSLLTFILAISFLSIYSQTINGFGKDSYSFMDGDELIEAKADYSKAYIVFSADLQKSTINDIVDRHPAFAISQADYPWPNHRMLVMDPAIAKNASEAEAYLEEIRSEPDVLSVYPALLRDGETAYADNTLLLNLPSEEAYPRTITELIEPYEGLIVEEIDLLRTKTYVVSLPSDVNIFRVAVAMKQDSRIIYAQPNLQFTGYLGLIPDDPRFDDQWFLDQASDADIDAPEAWDITTGSTDISVAVIDGHGFDMDHVEMVGKYISPFDAVLDNNDPAAVNSLENHGTPCAGLIGALTNNGTGVASVGFNTTVVPIRIGFNFNGGSFQTTEVILIRACEHVMTSPYDIVAVSNSYSMGSWSNIQGIRDAFANMRTDSRSGLGCVVLASTGNENAFNSVGYPSHFAHVVGVGSSNRFDARSSFSNYGDSTDVVAPGSDTWTIDRMGSLGYTLYDYYEFNGTSASCPIASAVVALIASVNPAYTWQELQNRLCATCDKIGGYSYGNDPNYPYDTWNLQVGYGRVNAFNAVEGGGLNPPQNLTANVTGSDVLLSWDPPGGGIEEELIYDNNVSTASYRYPGYTMSTHMSPSGPCQVLTLKYYTTNQGPNTFNAKVFNWTGSQPGTTVLYSSSQTAPDNDWIEVDVSASGINVSGDFVVGFGSVDTMAFLGFDANLNNGRSWDFQEPSGPWTTWEEAYLIRAVVRYADGKVAELGGKIPETRMLGGQQYTKEKRSVKHEVEAVENQNLYLKGLIGYKVYRDGSLITSNPVTNTYYEDLALATGTYSYTVTALYDEGESNPAGPVEAIVSGIPLDPPTNLQSSVNGNDVNLSWAAPSGGNEVWLYYHDNTFETSFSSTDGGAGLAQLFTLQSTPATLNGIRFFSSDYMNWNQPMTVYVLSGNGNTVLGGPFATSGLNNDWVSINTSVQINSSTFMIATYNDNADGPYVGVDDSYFNASLYFGNHTTGFTELSQLGDYEYIGSHEALVQYSDKQNRAAEWIKPDHYASRQEPLVHHEKMPLSASYPDAIKALLGYNIYRDGSKINSSVWTNTTYTDQSVPNGTYNYSVTAVYEEGESSQEGPIQVTVNNTGLEIPTDLTAYISGTNEVSLNWNGPGGSEEELIYDNGQATSAYKYPGFTMSTQMSPAGPCKILTLKYLTSIDAGDNTFKARVFGWEGSEPGNTILYEETVTAVEGWLDVDVSGQNLMMNGDFVVGFGSVNETTYLGYDANLNNGRSWDWNEATSTWETYFEAYLIRAIVLYSNGTKAEIGAKDLLGYNLYRDNVPVNTSLITTSNTTDMIPGWGTFVYNVTAVYDEGESAFSDPASVEYYFGIDEDEQVEARIYPNPAKDFIMVETEAEIKTLSLFNTEGRILIKQEVPGNSLQLDVGEVVGGIYFIKIETERGFSVYKVLIR
ncbi:MAG: S8 family serine peptidase [Bacteroidales bacterium]|jgi:hypothetical protein|nr:S8 family serine peptidase [Bacteroidales bacterium]